MKKLVVLVAALAFGVGFAQTHRQAVNSIFKAVDATFAVQGSSKTFAILSPLTGAEIRNRVYKLSFHSKDYGLVVIQSSDGQTIVFRLHTDGAQPEYRATFLAHFLVKVGDGYAFNQAAFESLYNRTFADESSPFGSGAPPETTTGTGTSGVSCQSQTDSTGGTLVCTQNGKTVYQQVCTITPDNSISCDSNTY